MMPRPCPQGHCPQGWEHPICVRLRAHAGPCRQSRLCVGDPGAVDRLQWSDNRTEACAQGVWGRRLVGAGWRMHAVCKHLGPAEILGPVKCFSCF